MESLLIKLYSRCKVGDSETATSSSGSNPGKEGTAAQATCSDREPKPVVPRAIQRDERASLPHSRAPPFRGQDGTTSTDHDSSDNTRSHVLNQRPLLREDLTHQSTARALNSPPHNAVAQHDLGTLRLLELESGDTTASKDLFVDRRSSLASGEPVADQSMDQVLSANEDGDVSLSRQEMESFELLDISEFENDNS